MKPIIAATFFALATNAGAVWADTPPPPGAQPLSAILAMIEADHDIAWIDEVEWEDDRGLWEIEAILSSGAQLTLRVDPLTGNVVR